MAPKPAIKQTATSISLYQSNIISVDRLLKTTVGREKLLEDLIAKLTQNINKKSKQRHHLLIGPRGVGKTHFLTLIENIVRQDKDLASHYQIIRFSDVNNRLLSCADILLEIIRILAEDVNNRTLQDLHSKLSVSDSDKDIIDAIVPYLKKYARQNNITFLLFLDNFQSLLMEQIKKAEDIENFRAFLIDTGCVTLIGTALSVVSGISSINDPFFKFFDTQILDEFDEKMVLEVIQKNLEFDNQIEILDNFTSKILTLYTMTGGNPRLIMMLNDLISLGNVVDINTLFQKLLDQVTPYYQDRLKELAPQERALLETMANIRFEPRSPGIIAKYMRKPQQQISSLLKRLTQAGYLTVSENPEDKRSRLYFIKDGFFDLWLAMHGPRSQRNRLNYLVYFFELYYRYISDQEERRDELWKKLKHFTANTSDQNLYGEILDDLSDSDDKNEGFQAGISNYHEKYGNLSLVNDYLNDFESFSIPEAKFKWIGYFSLKWMDGNDHKNIQNWIGELIQCWKIQRTGDLERVAEIAGSSGFKMSKHDLYKIQIKLYSDILNGINSDEDKNYFYFEMARSQFHSGQLTAAESSLKKALASCRKNDNWPDAHRVMSWLALINFELEDHQTAIKFLNECVKISREIGNQYFEVENLYNLGLVYYRDGQIADAIKCYDQGLLISQAIKYRPGEQNCLFGLGIAHIILRQKEKAVNYIEHTLIRAIETDDKHAQGRCIFIFALIDIKSQIPNTKITRLLKKSFNLFHEIQSPDAVIVKKWLDA